MLRFQLSLALLAALFLSACGSSTSPPANEATTTVREGSAGEAPLWRYVNSGWVYPDVADDLQVFSEELKVFVITSQDELDAFQQGFTTRRTFGTTTSLGRIDFPGSILLAAYYLWRPFQGDPLSVAGFSVEGDRADVFLHLDDSPQGKEYPYLLAPMIMVSVDRSQFPSAETLDFVFHLNGEPQTTVVATVE